MNFSFFFNFFCLSFFYWSFNKEELKEEFLKYFTLKDWDASERCSELDIITDYIVSNYLKMDFVPTVFDKIKDESFYDKEFDCIIINEDYLYKPDVTIRLLLMELRHRYQVKVLSKMDTNHKIISQIKEELLDDSYPSNYDDSKELSDYLSKTKSVDRFAFLVIMLEEIWSLSYHYPEKTFDAIIHEYAKKYRDILIKENK